MSLTIFQKGVIIVLVPLVTELAFVAVLVREENRYSRSQSLTLHSKEVIELTHRLMAQVLELQSRLRGYAVIGDASEIRPLARLLDQLDLEGGQLQELVADSPPQQERAGRVRESIGRSIEWYRWASQPAQAGDHTMVGERIRSGDGSENVEQVRGELAEFLAAEEALDRHRSDELEELGRAVNVTLILGAAVSFTATVALALFFSNGIVRRLRILTENARRFAAREALAAPLSGSDEIAEADRAFRSMAEDWTRLTAEQHRAAERIRDLYNRAPCGYHSVNADGIIVTINDTELGWLGRSREAVEGKARFTDFLNEEGRQKYADEFLIFKERGHVFDVEFELKRPDGSVMFISLSSTAICDEEGKYVASRSTLFDITERRKTKAALRAMAQQLEQRVVERTAELSEANRELLQKNQENELFVYSVSHDLRSPLVNLEGFSKELSRACEALRTEVARDGVSAEVKARTDELLDTRIAKSLGFIHSAVTRLSSIIDALLRLSRAGRIEFHWAQVDVRRVVAEVVASLHDTISAKGAEVRVQALPPVRGDATSLGQVFANLIGNALHYLDAARRGQIEVAGHVEPDGTVLFSVRDNGLGIAQSQHQKIFQLFQRAHPRAGPGEGLGLAIVSRIVERHRGKVWVESQPGEGSTFFVRLPPSVPAAASPLSS